MQYGILFAIGISLVLTSEERFALAQTSSLFESQALTGDELKTNPLAQKILSEIESFKKHVVQIEQEQKNMELNAMQIDQQRELAGQLELEAIASTDAQNAPHSPKAAFESFVYTINDTSAQNIFWGEFAFMSQRVDAGNAAMQQVLDNGGSWQEAMQEFSKNAAITHQEMIQENTDLNIQYGRADPSVQSDFDTNGMLPVDYVKVPNRVIPH